MVMTTKLPYTRSEAKTWAKQTVVDFYDAPLTPFTPDYEIDVEGVRKNIDAYVEMGVTGLVLGGFIAEAWNMTLDGWKRYHEIHADAAAGRIPLWTIILDPSVHQALEKMEFAARLGYVGAEVINPIVQFRTDGEVLAWYQYLTDHTDMAVFLYSTPVSGKVLSLDLVTRLAEIPTIVGIKHGGSLNHYDALRLRGMAPDDFIVSDPDEYWFLDDLRNGGQVMWAGPEFIVYGKLRRHLREYIDLARAGKWEEARDAWLKARPAYDIYQEVLIRYVAKTASYVGAFATVKAWYDLVGLEAGGGVMRPPVPLISAERREWLAGRLAEAGVI